MQDLTFSYPTAIEISIPALAINLSLCIIASFILRYIYITRSVSLSGKFHIGTAIPILATVTFLVIMVVKSSLALSLGLVGALSVIRFRTPIKEPEELVYLFLAISIGLGYGAGQTFVTSVVFIISMLMIMVWLSRSTVSHQDDYNLLIEWPESGLDVKKLIGEIEQYVEMLDVQKFNSGPDNNTLFAKVSVMDIDALQNLMKSVRKLSPDVRCSFFEARPMQ